MLDRKTYVSGTQRWMPRRELAVYYFPNITPTAAVNRLRRWIISDPRLLRDLVRAGYQKRQRVFTPQVMRVFRRYFS